MVMAREKFVDGNNESKAEDPEDATEPPEQPQEQEEIENDIGLPDGSISRSCVRWAGIVKKGQPK